MANLAYYLGPWQWVTEEGLSFWRAPVGTRGLIDLRSLSTQALAGTLGDRPYGFFAVDPAAMPGSDYRLLATGDCREIAADSAMRDAWQSLLGYRPAGDKLVDLLWGQLTNGSDPTGDEPVMPLMPGVDRTCKLMLGGHSLVKSSRFHVLESTPHADRVRTLLQRQYAANLARLGDHAGRVLDFWCEKYGLNKRARSQWERLVPPELRRDARLLPHQTTITESFDQADSDILGPDLTWTELAGDTDVVSNKAQFQTLNGTSLARADSDLSSDDHYGQAVFTGWAGTGTTDQQAAGSICRKDGTATLTYYHGRIVDATNDNCQLFKFVAGAATQLGTDVPLAVGASHTVKTQSDGSTIEMYLDGASQISVSDTAITGNLRCGIRAFLGSSAARISADDFEAADAGGAELLIQGILSGGRLSAAGIKTGGHL